MESCAEAAGPMDENPPPLGGGQEQTSQGDTCQLGAVCPPPLARATCVVLVGTTVYFTFFPLPFK